ncbi:MAG: hypothetical protein RI897_2044 [Verrucomicrobiota bacterium]
MQQGEEFVFGEGLELEDLGAGDEGGVDEEEGVFGGGSDEADCTAFHVGQENILLGFIEAVDFIDEEEGGLGLVSESVGGFGEDLADIGHRGFHTAEAFEVVGAVFGDEAGEGGFSGAWGSEEDHGLDPLGFDGSAEQFAFGEEVGLADEFGEELWPHACGERLGWGWAGGVSLIEAGGCGIGEQVAL